MIKIGVCDDNQTLLNKYKKMINEIAEKSQIEFTLNTFNDGFEVLQLFMDDRECLDILFLDILMDKINGIETARKIRQFNSKVIIIFLTSSEEYIFESIGLNAMAYLLKDQLTTDTFEKTLVKAIDLAQETKEDILKFEKNGYIYKLSLNDICFLKIYKGYIYIHHWDGIIFESLDLTIVEELLNNGFYRVHEQYIVSLQYIGRIEKNYVILSDQSKNEIPLDKKLTKDLKMVFANYMIAKAKGEIVHAE